MIEQSIELLIVVVFSVLGAGLLIAAAPIIVLASFFILEVSMSIYAKLFEVWGFRPVVNLFEGLGDKARRGREGTIPFFKKFYGGAWRFLTTMFSEGRDFIREWREAH